MSGYECRPRAHLPTPVSCSNSHESTIPRTHPGPLHPNTGSSHQEGEKFLNFMEKATMTISQKPTLQNSVSLQCRLPQPSFAVGSPRSQFSGILKVSQRCGSEGSTRRQVRQEAQGKHFCTTKARETGVTENWSTWGQEHRGMTANRNNERREGEVLSHRGDMEGGRSQFSSGLSAGGPQGCSIFSIKLKRTRALLSFSAIAK